MSSRLEVSCWLPAPYLQVPAWEHLRPELRKNTYPGRAS